MACPPSSVIATSNEILVRVDDFSKSIASVLFFKELEVFPRALFSFRSDATSSMLMISAYDKSAKDNRWDGKTRVLHLICSFICRYIFKSLLINFSYQTCKQGVLPMMLYEHAAKEIFARYGIPVPSGNPVTDADEAGVIAGRLGSVVIKAQVAAGGRGKAGGIQTASTPQEAVQKARRILGMSIKGLPVKKVLVEEYRKPDREMYLGITIDRRAGGRSASDALAHVEVRAAAGSALAAGMERMKT